VIKQLQTITKEKLSTISLMIGMFFLPFGYDAIFKIILDWTNSYWITDIVFYFLSGLFFIYYYYFPVSKYATKALMLGMFFLPFGYDFIFKLIMNVTNYWIADLIFYLISGIFFFLYFYFSGINPIKNIMIYFGKKYIQSLFYRKTLRNNSFILYLSIK